MSNEITVEQMNEAIALFMGGSSIKEIGGKRYVYYPNSCAKEVTDLKYHASWDWLMPVVEKIEAEHAHVAIHVRICAIYMKFMAKRAYAKANGIPTEDVMPIAECNEYGFIGNVFHAVYQFITWYNNQQPTTNGQ